MARRPYNTRLSDLPLLTKRLNARSQLQPDTGCILWQGSVKTLTRPYGHMRVEGRIYKTHRLAAYLHLGLNIADKKIEVCHTCDNPRCINPKHLFLGDHTRNMRDAFSKKRMNSAYGERCRNTKLTVPQVQAIKEARPKGKVLVVLAKELGVRPITLRRILKGETWAHVSFEDR